MEPVNSDVFDHEQSAKLGVLLVNLGTPTAPTAAGVKSFLREFLSDPRVVDAPRWLWRPLLELVILNIRPRQSARAYRQIWSERGSPLRVHTRDQVDALREALREHPGEQVLVQYAFRYGTPSIATRVDELQSEGVRKLLVIPLFPQYSGATNGAVFDALAQALQARPWVPELRLVTHYHDHPRYISALAGSVRSYRQQQGSAEKLLFSYHGIPQRYRDAGDPYFCECHKTTRLVAEALGLSEAQYATAFQSRFGPGQWVEPATDDLLRAWAGQGVRAVQVICPGFAGDCLETLEEVAIRYRELFRGAGGEAFGYIPALNSEPGQIELLTALVRDNLQGWLHGHDSELPLP